MRREIVFRPWLLPLCWSLGAGSGMAADGTLTSSRDELYRQVFKHAPPPIPVESFVLVIVGSARQKMRAVLEDGQGLLLEGKALTALLSQQLRQDQLRRLEQRIDNRGLLDRGAIEAAGIATAFNPRTFEYSLTIAAAMREPGIVYLTPPLPDPFAAQAIRPAAFSGFLNFNIKGAGRKTSFAAGSRDSHEVGIALDGALNLNGLVLEGSAFGQAGAARSWNRGDLRLVHDRPQQALRFTAGDLSYPLAGYQTGIPTGGIGVTKDYALQPNVLTFWTGDFAFKLDRPAEVKLFSNDSLINTLQLPAGIHDLRRFTPAVGQNDIDIVIEDSAGRREVLHYSFIHDPRLLDKGLSLYSWNAGFARGMQGGAYHYDTDRPVFAGSYLRGVTTTTTLGGYAQVHDEQGLLGLQVLRALPLGTLLLDGATSRSEGRWDGAARIALTTNKGWHRPEAYLAVEYLGNRFNSTVPHRRALNAQASLATPLGRGVTARLGASYYSARGPVRRAQYDAAATLLQTWSRYASGSLALRRRAGADTDIEVLFGVRINFTHDSGSYYLAKEPERDGVNAHWNSRRSNNVSAPYGFANARTGPDIHEYQAGAGYSGNQGLAEATYLRSETSPHDSREETSLRLQGALVFAGDEFALSRPIRENFAIVAGRHGLADVAIKVDPGRNGGSPSGHGPTVVADLSSYRLRTLRLEPVDPPPGATPESMTFQLAPTYKSGVLLKVGRESSIVAIGRLVDASGAGVAHVPLVIRRVGDPDPAIETFTGRNGNFQVPELRSGKYEVHFSGTWRGAVMLEIPETPEGIHRLGEIAMPAEIPPQ